MSEQFSDAEVGRPGAMLDCEHHGSVQGVKKKLFRWNGRGKPTTPILCNSCPQCETEIQDAIEMYLNDPDAENPFKI